MPSIYEIVSDLFDIPTDQLSPNTTLEELDIDDIDLIDLTMELEEQFEVLISDNTAFAWTTLDSIDTCVSKLGGKKGE